MSIDMNVVQVKDIAVRLWMACGRNAHVAHAIVNADKTITIERKVHILGQLVKLHQIYNP